MNVNVGSAIRSPWRRVDFAPRSLRIGDRLRPVGWVLRSRQLLRERSRSGSPERKSWRSSSSRSALISIAHQVGERLGRLRSLEMLQDRIAGLARDDDPEMHDDIRRPAMLWQMGFEKYAKASLLRQGSVPFSPVTTSHKAVSRMLWSLRLPRRFTPPSFPPRWRGGWGWG